MKLIRWLLKASIGIASTIYVMHLATINDISQALSIIIGSGVFASYNGLDWVFDKVWPE